MEVQRPQSKQPIPERAKIVFKGILFDVYQWEQELYDGTITTFEKIKRPDTVVVFPILPDGKILLTEQQQPGKKPFIGATGGQVDKKETPLAVAKRELLEESGYEASEYILWHAEQPASKIEWAVYVFIAKGLKKSKEQNLDAGEKISLKPVSFEEFLEIGTNDVSFSEKEIIPKLLEAKLYPEKKELLQKLFRS
jgi:8-oxo-dGTP pyrophosphatase MutT (NUDIX family)